MKTSSKYRRLVRQRKLRRQRSRALAVLMVVIVVVMAAHVAFSKQTTSNDGYDVIPVVLKQGDTLWTIAQQYKPEGADLREYVYAIAANNGIKDGNIFSGQTIYVPVEL